MSDQLGFDALLAETAQINQQRVFNEKTSGLPATMDEGIPYYSSLLDQHHTAVMRADVDRAMSLNEEAHNLAVKLNDGDPGIIADDDAPGYVLARATQASPGTVPLYGQQGEFTIEIGTMKVLIELKGLFHVCGRFSYWPSFYARAVELDRPFLSCTGFRSFLGCNADPLPGICADEFCRRVVSGFVEHELNNKLELIKPEYRPDR